jgi:hypothetical protein
VDATHFRQRAAHAREMAQSGDDLRLSRMLLDVALDLEAEAEAIEAQTAKERRGHARVRVQGLEDGLLHSVDASPGPTPVQVINLSRGGARLRAEHPPTIGNRVTLELPCQGLNLIGTILRVRGKDASMVFEPITSDDPGLNRLLRTEPVAARA